MAACTCDSFTGTTGSPALTCTNTSTGNALVVTQTTNNVYALNVSSAATSNAGIYCINSASGYSIIGENSSAAGSGVRGVCSNVTNTGSAVVGNTAGTGNGVRGTCTNTGNGVKGEHTGATGNGVYGTTTGTGAGVYGVTANTGNAVHGEKTGGNAGNAVYGSTNGTGAGVHGTTSGNGYGVHGTTSGNGYGVYGWTSGTGHAVYGGTNNTGNAVTGNTSGTGNGVYGTTNNTGSAVYGEAVGSSGYGVRARSTGTGHALYTTATNANANCVFASHTNGTAIYGITSLSTGVGIVGNASTITGANVGVKAITASSAGIALLAEAFNGLPGSAGVKSYGRIALWGVCQGTTVSDYGVYATATGSAKAGVFSGNVEVLGTLSKSAGTFAIDHPLDPENKVLRHSFVESPDMMNVYNGMVSVGSTGTETVELPSYFEALNKDFRYTLTSVGASAPNLHVSAKVKDNKFEIAGAIPGTEVSWTVTGVRKDAYAEANRVVVESSKDESQKGLFLNPECYGKDAKHGLGRHKH